MNRKLVFITLLAIAVVAIAVILQVRMAQSPSAPLMHLDGSAAKLDVRGAPLTIVHFWGTWCPPCRTEIPAFNRFVQRSRGSSYRIIPIAVEPNANDVAAFLASNNARIDTLLDPAGSTADAFNIEVFPTTLVFDRNGNVVQRAFGPVEWDDDSVRAHLQSLAR